MGLLSWLGLGGGGGTTVNYPSPPDYGASTEKVFQAQLKYAPELIAAEKKYQPLYQQLQSQIQAQSAKDQLALYQQLQPEYSNLENAFTRAQQINQLEGLRNRAPEYIQTFKRAQGTAGIDKIIQDYAEKNLADQLSSGKLNPEEQRQLEQSSLQSYAARGTSLGSQAGLSSVLNRYQYLQQRKQQALQQASGIGSYLAQQSGPALTSFYQQPMYAGAFGGQAVQNALMSQQQAGPQYFNPESQTGIGSIYGAYNAQMNLAGAQAQAGASQSAGQMGMLGSLGGAAISTLPKLLPLLGMCWVAREVYGHDNPAWEMFRDWMLFDAPVWFRELYIEFGERFAKFIQNKPLLKRIIRKWMDSKINS